MKNKILKYIDAFKSYDKNNILVNTFTKGYCYQFALILQERFGGTILYDPVEGHFVTLIDDCLFDITGDVTDKYPHINTMYSKETYLSILSIVEDCILKL